MSYFLGIVNPIKASLKFDKTGVGHDIGKEFTNHWWDQAFKKASNGIHIEKLTEGEIEVKSKGKLKSKNKAKSEKKEQKKSLYKAFVKSATLQNGKMVNEPLAEELDDPSNSEKGTPSTAENHIQTLDYDELFKSIGVTAHKGARHGVSMQAKLKRVQQKDEEYLHLQKKKKMKAKCDNTK